MMLFAIILFEDSQIFLDWMSWRNPSSAGASAGVLLVFLLSRIPVPDHAQIDP